MSEQELGALSATPEVAGVRRTVQTPVAEPGLWQRLSKRWFGGPRPEPIELSPAPLIRDADTTPPTPRANRGPVELTPNAAAQKAAAAANPPTPREVFMHDVEHEALDKANRINRAFGLPESSAYIMDESLIREHHARLLERVERANTLDARMAHMHRVGEPTFDFLREEVAAKPRMLDGLRARAGQFMQRFRRPAATVLNASELGRPMMEAAVEQPLPLPMDAPHVVPPVDPTHVTERLQLFDGQTPTEWPTGQRLYAAEEARLAAAPAPELPDFLKRGTMTTPSHPEAALAAPTTHAKSGFAQRLRGPALGGALAATSLPATAMNANGESWHGAPLEREAVRLHLPDHQPLGLPEHITITPKPTRADVLAREAIGAMPPEHLAALKAKPSLLPDPATVARPGLRERASSMLARLNPLRPLELPKTQALQQSELPQAIRERAVFQHGAEPHLPFAENAASKLPIDHYDGWEALQNAAGGDLLKSQAKLGDAAQIVANATPAAVPTAAVTTAAEIEAAGQLRFPNHEPFGPPAPNWRKLSDVPFGPPAPVVITEAAEAAEALVERPKLGARILSSLKKLSPFGAKTKEIPDMPMAPAPEIANEVVHARGNGGIILPEIGKAVQETKGRPLLIAAGTLAAVGGAAWLASDGKHQRREAQRRLDAAALAPEQGI